MGPSQQPQTETRPSVTWSVVPQQTTSPYVRDIVQSLRSQGVDVEPLSLISLAGARRKVVHVQWPEHVSRGPSLPRTLAKHVRALCLLIALKLRGHKVVVTAHNISPHGKSNRFDAYFRGQINEIAEATVVLVPDHEFELRELGQVGRNSQVLAIRHPAPDYDGPKCGHRDGGLLMLGQIHPYRQQLQFVDSLIAQGNTRTLRIAGSVGDQELLEALRLRERSQNWLHLYPGYMEDDELSTILDDTAAVVSLQRNVLNSGGPFFALARGIPVALTEGSQARSLAHEIGEEWIFQVPTDLRALNITSLNNWIHLPRSRPNLADYSADAVAREHAALYQLLSSRT